MRIPNLRALLPGLGLVGSVTLLAQLVGTQWPLMGSAVAGILLGLIIRACFHDLGRSLAGVLVASQYFLQWSIVGLGFALPIHTVLDVGLNSLTVTLVTLSSAFLCALIVGRFLHIPIKLCVLIGGGTAICGGSAIAAMTPVIKPDHHETAFSLSTIFLFNIIAVLIFPPIGHWLGLTDRGFGMWAGIAINDTSSVVAAAYAWSKDAGDYATIVKLSRAMLIVPVTVILGLIFVRADKNESTKPKLSIPWFIVFFVVASMLNDRFPPYLKDIAHPVATWMITAALTAIGLSTDLSKMKNVGWRPVALGLLTWWVVACTSLLMQAWEGRW